MDVTVTKKEGAHSNRTPRQDTDPQGGQILRSRNWIATPDLLSSQILFKIQSACTPRSSNIHSLHSWNIYCPNHGTQNLNFIHRVYRLRLPSISADLPSIGQLTGLGPFQPVTLGMHMFNKIIDLCPQQNATARL